MPRPTLHCRCGRKAEFYLRVLICTAGIAPRRTATRSVGGWCGPCFADFLEGKDLEASQGLWQSLHRTYFTLRSDIDACRISAQTAGDI